MTLLARQDYLQSLTGFIQSSRDAIKKFTQEMGWTVPPERPRSKMENSPLSSHTKCPEASQNGMDTRIYNEYSNEPLLPSNLVSSTPIFNVTIDANRQRNLLLPYKQTAAPDTRQSPASAGELTANFSREERLAMYEYTLQNTAAVATPPEILPLETFIPVDNQPKELSELELKKAMRDFKRRRQAYRTKVSTKNKSQTQVTREIIHNMMVVLGAEELEPEPVCTPGDSAASSNLHKPEKKIMYGISGKKVKGDYNRANESKLKWTDRRECDGSRNRGRKHDREYIIDSYKKNHIESEIEYDKEGKRSMKKDEERRNYDVSYYTDKYRSRTHVTRDKRDSEERKWEREYKKERCRYSDDDEKIKKISDRQNSERFQNDMSREKMAQYDIISVKSFQKGQNVTEEFENIIEKNREDREILSNESEKIYRDCKAGSSKHHKKHKLKRKKEKKSKEKQKEKRAAHSESEECVSDDSRSRGKKKKN